MIYFALGFPIWYLITPAAASISAYVAQPMVFLLDTHGLTQKVTSADATVLLYYSPAPTGKPFAISYRFVGYNTVLLFALIMAVPDVRPKLRLKIMLLGMAMLFPLQVLMVVLAICNYYSTLDINGKPFYPSIVSQTLHYSERLATRLNGELPPILIWAGLFFYYRWHRELLRR